MNDVNRLRRITTLLREVPGGVYVGEYIRRRHRHFGTDVLIDNFDGNLSIFLDLSEHMQSQIFWHGSYSRNILFLLRRILRPGMTFVDGGANIGEISLVAAKTVGSRGRVLAFEPVARFAEQLQRNKEANGFDHIEIQRIGLSDEEGHATLYLADSPYADGTHHDGLGTIFKSDARSKATAVIPLATLDRLLFDSGLGVDVIKLDIEGAELAALRGARETLLRHSPAIIIEIGRETCTAAGYKMEDILFFLGSIGYRFFRIERRGRLRPISSSDLRKFQNVYCVRGGNESQ